MSTGRVVTSDMGVLAGVNEDTQEFDLITEDGIVTIEPHEHNMEVDQVLDDTVHYVCTECPFADLQHKSGDPNR